MKSKKQFIIFVISSLLFQACQSVASAEPTAESTATSVPPAKTSVPTSTALPTETLEPTETPEPTNTPLPVGILFRDDFEGKFKSGWEWEKENPDKWTITDDGWLQIVGEYNALLQENEQNNLLWYPLPAGDFVITAHLKTKPFENFHQAAIFIYEDPENYITINRGYCDLCITGGNGIYMDYKFSGKWGTYKAAINSEDIYLRLENKDNTISGYYATSPDQWIRLGRFGNYFQFKKVGIGVSNARAANDVVGSYDYFEISLP